jgi:hypothetical protein
MEEQGFTRSEAMRHFGTEDESETMTPDRPSHPVGPSPGYDARPVAVLIAERDPRDSRLARALASAGVRTHAVRFAEAEARLAEQGTLDLIALEAEGATDAVLDVVLADVARIAREGRLQLMASVVPDQLDATAAHLLGTRAQLLCDPSDAELAAAAALARAASRARDGRVMSDSRDGSESERLRRLNEEVARIADVLAQLTREESERHGGVREPPGDYRGPDEMEPGDVTAHEVRTAIRGRRLRDQFFPEGLFADPAWDMLLDLFASHLEGRRVSVSSLCIAASVPPTTALRWISTMHDAGLFERQADPSDRRRAYIALSAQGIESMRGYIAAAKRAGLGLV